jgi:hypothetical protein
MANACTVGFVVLYIVGIQGIIAYVIWRDICCIRN